MSWSKVQSLVLRFMKHRYILDLSLFHFTHLSPQHTYKHTHTNLFVFIVFALVTIWLEIDELQNNNSIKYPVKKKKKGV